MTEDADKSSEGKFPVAKRTDLRRDVNTMVPDISFDPDDDTGTENRVRLEEAIESYYRSHGTFPRRYDGLEPIESEELPEDLYDNTRLQTISAAKMLEAFVLAAYIADATDEKLLLDDQTMRRAMYAIDSLQQTIRVYKGLSKNKKALRQRQRRVRWASKTHIDTAARKFFDENVDMRDLIIENDDTPSDELKVSNYFILERMYRLARSRYDVAKRDTDRMRATRNVYKNRLSSLERSYLNLKRKHEGEEAAARWKKMYDERMAKSDAKTSRRTK